MNKKLMAVAVAGALAAPGLVLAQSSTVTVSGTMNVEYGVRYKQPDGAGGVGRASVDALNSGASNFRVAGEEKLGGMSVWFQCESRLRFGQDVNPAQAGGTFCDRNSALGLKGGFGNFFIGRWDSPLNLAQDAGRGGLLNTAGWAGMEYLILADFGQAGFDWARRNPNSVNYVTPSFGGLTGSFQYTTTNAGIAAAAPTVGLKGRAISASAYYSSGPLEASLGYSKHEDNQSDTGGFNGASDKAWLLGASYVFGPFKVGVLYTDLEGDVTATTNVERKNWAVGAAWKITAPGTVKFGYTKAGDFKGTAMAGVTDTGAKQWQVSYHHALSKRTTAAAYYVKLKNDTNGTWGFPGTTVAPVFAGSSGSVISLQLAHKF